jgi:allantoin racemase
LSAFRLALINPNTDRGHTASMSRVIANTLPAGAQVSALEVARGPRSIESVVDGTFAAAEVLRTMRANPDHDGYLIACFSDPGLHGARELTSAPVVGIGEAAYRAASMIAKRFAVITTLARGIADLEDAIDAVGLARQCAGILALEIPVSEQGAHYPATTERILELGAHAVGELGAGALVLACGGMADVTDAVTEATGVPATNGVAIGALTAYALWRAGLRTSKRGAYAAPEPIPYTGMAEASAVGALLSEP